VFCTHCKEASSSKKTQTTQVATYNGRVVLPDDRFRILELVKLALKVLQTESLAVPWRRKNSEAMIYVMEIVARGGDGMENLKAPYYAPAQGYHFHH